MRSILRQRDGAHAWAEQAAPLFASRGGVDAHRKPPAVRDNLREVSEMCGRSFSNYPRLITWIAVGITILTGPPAQSQEAQHTWLAILLTETSFVETDMISYRWNERLYVFTDEGLWRIDAGTRPRLIHAGIVDPAPLRPSADSVFFLDRSRENEIRLMTLSLESGAVSYHVTLDGVDAPDAPGAEWTSTGECIVAQSEAEWRTYCPHRRPRALGDDTRAVVRVVPVLSQGGIAQVVGADGMEYFCDVRDGGTLEACRLAATAMWAGGELLAADADHLWVVESNSMMAESMMAFGVPRSSHVLRLHRGDNRVDGRWHFGGTAEQITVIPLGGEALIMAAENVFRWNHRSDQPEETLAYNVRFYNNRPVLIGGEAPVLAGANGSGARASIPEMSQPVLSVIAVSDGTWLACDEIREDGRVRVYAFGSGAALESAERPTARRAAPQNFYQYCGQLGSTLWFSGEAHWRGGRLASTGIYGHTPGVRPTLDLIATSRTGQFLESVLRGIGLVDWYVPEPHRLVAAYDDAPEWAALEDLTFRYAINERDPEEMFPIREIAFDEDTLADGMLHVVAGDNFGNVWERQVPVHLVPAGATLAFLGAVSGGFGSVLLSAGLLGLLLFLSPRADWAQRTLVRPWTRATFRIASFGILALLFPRLYGFLLERQRRNTVDEARRRSKQFVRASDRESTFGASALAERLLDERAIAITGPSGIGKSIYLCDVLPDLVDELGGRTPVHVVLRDASEDAVETIRAILANIGDITDAALADDMLESRSFLFVLDGFNEVNVGAQHAWRRFILKGASRPRHPHLFVVGSRIPIEDVTELRYGPLPGADAERMLRERIGLAQDLILDPATIELARLPQRLLLLEGLATDGPAGGAPDLPTTPADLLARVLAQVEARLAARGHKNDMVPLRAAGVSATIELRLAFEPRDKVSGVAVAELKGLRLAIELEGGPAFAHDSVRALFAASSLLQHNLQRISERSYAELVVWMEVIEIVAALADPDREGDQRKIEDIVRGLASSKDLNGIELAESLVFALTKEVGERSWLKELSAMIAVKKGIRKDAITGEPMRPWFESVELDFTRDGTQSAVRLLVAGYPTNAAALALAEDAGLKVSLLKQGDEIEYLMRGILKQAATARRLLQLVVTVLSDPAREGIHDALRALFAGHEAALAAAALRRKPSLTTLALLPWSVEVWPRGAADAEWLATSGLERTINAAAGFADPAVFRRGIAEAEVRTARIDIGGKAAGTGFLVGERLLLTAWHVVAPLEGGSVRAVARFDHKVSPTGAVTEAGRSVSFAKDWLVAHSPHEPVSMELAGDGPPRGRWDFALVRLEESVGSQGIGPDSASRGEQRDWYRLDGSAYAFEENEPILILGHPQGRPAQLSYASPARIRLTSLLSRVRYETNTEGGSSGSPVFNREWRVVALHHGTGPTSIPGPLSRAACSFNQGIPIADIVGELKTQLEGKPELTELGFD